MSRFFRRATLEPIKFSFVVHLLALEHLPASFPDSPVVIRWQRGSKRGGASKQVLVTKTGSAVCEKFELKATMFRDDKSLKFDSKVLSFYFDITGQASPAPDTCSLDLATLQLDDCSASLLRLNIRGGGALDGSYLSLKILPMLRGSGGDGRGVGSGGVRRAIAGDASDASDASVMSQQGGGCSDADEGLCGPTESPRTANRDDAPVITNTDSLADADPEALAQHQETLVQIQLKLAAARRRAAAVKYAAGDGASGDDHEARAEQHDVMAMHHRQLAAVHRAHDAGRNAAAGHQECNAAAGHQEAPDAAGVATAAHGGRIRSASGGSASVVAAREADPHNKFKGRFVTDKSGGIVRVEEAYGEQQGSFVAVDYALGSAAAAAASGVVLACNSMGVDAPSDVDGNENSGSGSSWWCGVCL